MYKKIIITSVILVLLLIVINVLVVIKSESRWFANGEMFDNVSDCLDAYTSCKPVPNTIVNLIDGFIGTLIYVILELTIIIGIYFAYKELKKRNNNLRK